MIGARCLFREQVGEQHFRLGQRVFAGGSYRRIEMLACRGPFLNLTESSFAQFIEAAEYPLFLSENFEQFVVLLAVYARGLFARKAEEQAEVFPPSVKELKIIAGLRCGHSS